MRLYGPDKCTFNMHLHLHLKQTLLNFGPAHVSAFERFNGYLGSYYTNNRAIESQIMQRFTQHQGIYSIPMSPEIRSIFHQSTDINSTYCSDSLFLLHLAYDPLNTIQTFAWKDDIKALLLLPPFFEEVFTSETISQLTHIYKQVYPNRDFFDTIIPVT